MFAIISLLLVVLISIIITRIASVALTHTGMSRESARFQARSAFTGAGFTTNESEMVVNHPIRRRIVLFLMLLGNAGIVTAVSSLILTFVRQDQAGGGSLTMKIVILVAGLTLLWVLAMSRWVDRHISNLIDKFLNRYTQLDVTDYASILHLAGDYRLAELLVKPDDWLDGKSMLEAQLKDEGVIVLGIDRSNGKYVGTPMGGTRVYAGDTLVLYGRTKDLREIDRREKGLTGDIKHYYATQEQQKVEKVQSREDETDAAGHEKEGKVEEP